MSGLLLHQELQVNAWVLFLYRFLEFGDVFLLDSFGLHFLVQLLGVELPRDKLKELFVDF